MFRSLFFSESEHPYQPVLTVEPAVENIPYAPFTTLDLNLVTKITGHLADAGDWKAIAALSLTNKRFYAMLADDSVYGKLTMPVTIDNQRHYLPMKNINHVVLANYYVNVEQHQQQVRNEVEGAEIAKTKAEERCEKVNNVVGIVGIVGLHVGMMLLCDWVILPGIANILPGNCFSAWCPGLIYNCNPVNAPDCYSACCCSCCCGGSLPCQTCCSNSIFMTTNVTAYNITACVPDVCGAKVVSHMQEKLSDYYDHKIQKKQAALAEITELAPLSDPTQKLTTNMIGKLFQMNAVICQHKNNRHQLPEALRMEDVRTKTHVPSRLRMN